MSVLHRIWDTWNHRLKQCIMHPSTRPLEYIQYQRHFDVISDDGSIIIGPNPENGKDKCEGKLRILPKNDEVVGCMIMNMEYMRDHSNPERMEQLLRQENDLFPEICTLSRGFMRDSEYPAPRT